MGVSWSARMEDRLMLLLLEDLSRLLGCRSRGSKDVEDPSDRSDDDDNAGNKGASPFPLM